MNAVKLLIVIIFLSTPLINAENLFSPKSFYDTAKSYERSEPAKAVSLYNASARGGYLPAQLLVGGLYRYGLAGVEQDCKQSIYWYERAAEQDSLDAVEELASTYADSKDKCFAPEKAAILYKGAAKNGHGQAQQGLARLYIQGTGVQRDLISAYAWLSASMKNGLYESSLNLRDRIEKIMTASEVEKAKSLSKSYVEKNIEK